MNVQQARVLLKNISSLVDSHEQYGHLASIDRDVLLSYVRQLYEIILSETPMQTEVVRSHTEPSVATYDTNANVKDAVPEQEIAPAYDLTPSPVMPTHQVAPLVEEAPTPPPAPVGVPETPVYQPSVSEEVKSQPVPAPVPVPQVTPAAVLNPEALREIFAELTIRDLSDKLAMSPIQDLSKAMGLNEKMLTQQELFGNNAQVFQETILRINASRTFEEAKEYLMNHIMGTYNWTNESKVKKAALFVKLVRRRFL